MGEDVSKLRLALEITTVLTSLAGLAVSFVQGEVLAAGVLAGVAVSTTGYAVYDQRAGPFRFQRTSWKVAMDDSSGDRVTFTKTREIVPRWRGVSEFNDIGFKATGKIEFTGCDIGKIVDIRRDGGDYGLRILKDTPFKPGKSIKYSIEGRMLNSFRDAHEDWVLDAIHPCRYDLTIRFNEKRPPRNIRVTRISHGMRVPIDDYNVSPDGLQLFMDVSNPDLGSRYKVEWDW